MVGLRDHVPVSLLVQFDQLSKCRAETLCCQRLFQSQGPQVTSHMV